jgi:hypothetical protein
MRGDATRRGANRARSLEQGPPAHGCREVGL